MSSQAGRRDGDLFAGRASAALPRHPDHRDRRETAGRDRRQRLDRRRPGGRGARPIPTCGCCASERNIGYGGAINRAVAETRSRHRVRRHRQSGRLAGAPGSIDTMLEAARRWPRAGALGPLIREPGRHRVPVGAPGARARVGRRARDPRHGVADQPVDRAVPPGERDRSASARSAGCRGRACCCGAPPSTRSGFRLPLLHVHGGRRSRRPPRPGRLAERVRALGRGDARTRATPPGGIPN